MAEILGIVASIITIAQTLQPVLSLARTVYKAQDELRDMQSDLAELVGFLEILKHRNPDHSSPYFQSTLCTLRQTLEQFKAVIQDKLLRSDNGKIRPVSWLIHRKKVELLQSKLQDSKQKVLVAVSIEIFETTVTSDATLLDISTQTRAILGILAHMDEKLTQDCQSSDNIRPSHRHIIDTMSPLITTCVPDGCFSNTTSIPSSAVKCQKRRNVEFTQCKTTLEHFPNDYPEIYGKVMVPKLMITALYEETSSRFSRTNYYRVLFHRSPRRWIHLNISLEIPSDSKYWTVAALHGDPKHGFLPSHLKSFSVPTSLLELMKRAFARYVKNIADDTHSHLWLSNESIEGLAETTMGQCALVCSGPKKTHTPAKHSGEAILSSLHHLGCRKVSMGQVIQLASLEIPHQFIAVFEGQLVQEIKSDQQPPNAEFCYNIEVLHCLRDQPGILRLLGLTVDESQNDLHSYLIKYPDTECDFLLEYASKLSKSWNWSQMENIAWQLIHRINSVHTTARHFVVGTLWMARPPIWIDAFGQLHLYFFKKTLDFRSLALPFYPPEFHKYTKLAHANPKHTKSPSITKEFDLYQLGQILWILAESWATGESAQKLKESFHKNSETFQGESFSRRSAFPRLSQNIPDYFRLMVEESCAESPYARPRAVDLLSRFPSTCFDIISVKQKNQSSQVIDVKTLLKCRVRSVLCSICHAHITSITYRCIICVGGDFDLCQHCFDKRRHCNDHSHLLGEILVDIIPSDVTRYHSSVDSLGARHITEL